MLANSTNADSRRGAGDTPQHFTILLFGLFLFLFMAPLSWLIKTHLFSEIGSALMVSVLSIDILFAAWVASARRRDRTIAFALAAPTLVAYGASLVVGGNLFWGAAHALGILFLGHAMVVVARYVFAAKRVTWNTVSAALCFYLLFGIGYGLLYCILFILDPGSFSLSIRDGPPPSFESETMITGIYYSLVTMTTLGYGDIIPATAVTRMAAAVQALLGQLYVAVLVARLVGMQVADSMNEDK
jgi:hypothetical protein